MMTLLRRFFNRRECRLALVVNRDGSVEMVSVLARIDAERVYTFQWPYVKGDCGREVPERYMQYLSAIGGVYVWYAMKAAKRFPKWVTI